MKKYRVSGIIDDVGYVQVDVETISKSQAEIIAIDDYDFDEVLKVSEI